MFGGGGGGGGEKKKVFFFLGGGQVYRLYKLSLKILLFCILSLFVIVTSFTVIHFTWTMVISATIILYCQSSSEACAPLMTGQAERG